MDNTAAEKLIDALSDASRAGTRCGAETVQDLFWLEDDERMAWVASTFTDGNLINVFRCVCSHAPDAFVASYHSDGGAICGYGGPYPSFDEVASEIETSEGWTMV